MTTAPFDPPIPPTYNPIWKAQLKLTHPRPRAAFETLGCKVNQAETEALMRSFADAGYEISSPDDCDVYVLNTCSVTHIADRKSRHLLRSAKRRNPRALLVAAGCYAASAPQELERLGVDLVVGNADKRTLPHILQESGHISTPAPIPNPHCDGMRTRAFVKIQDGCNSFCSYCIVPVVRGREKSVPLDAVLSQVQQFAASGYQEIVVTGVKAGAYASGAATLTDLLRQMLALTDVPRIRISSLQPKEITPDLLGLWQNPRICPHFHMSIQSGSDTVLQRMMRGYSADDYVKSVSLVRSMVPHAAITTDVIVGFPGETDAEFQQSYDRCRDIGFARIHVFPFSPRRGTPAAQLPAQIPHGVKKELAGRMLELARDASRMYCRCFLGDTREVLWERGDDRRRSGITDNYIRVFAHSDKDLTNRLTPARLVEVVEDGMNAEV